MVASEKPHWGAWRVPFMKSTTRYESMILRIWRWASSTVAPSSNWRFCFARRASEGFMRHICTSGVFPGGASPVVKTHFSIQARAVFSSSALVGLSQTTAFALWQSAPTTCKCASTLEATFLDIATYCMTPSLSKQAYTPDCDQLSGMLLLPSIPRRITGSISSTSTTAFKDRGANVSRSNFLWWILCGALIRRSNWILVERKWEVDRKMP
mmetsp:Transcript_44285/g.92605  ORF Transcript_44285/g.92605 Transcript_44285/m.92605 type:complete len:211 (-) Transcript_44285:88-720(-)